MTTDHLPGKSVGLPTSTPYAFAAWAAAQRACWTPPASKCQGYAEPHDVAGEVVLHLLSRRTALPAFASPRQALAYLRRAAAHAAISMWRKQRRMVQADLHREDGGAVDGSYRANPGMSAASQREARTSLPEVVSDRVRVLDTLEAFAASAPPSERDALRRLWSDTPTGRKLPPAERAARCRARKRLARFSGAEEPARMSRPVRPPPLLPDATVPSGHDERNADTARRVEKVQRHSAS